MLLAGVVLKLLPVIVTDVPGLAGFGDTEVTDGGIANGEETVTTLLADALPHALLKV
jgi:hypothetical protein